MPEMAHISKTFYLERYNGVIYWMLYAFADLSNEKLFHLVLCTYRHTESLSKLTILT